MKEDVYFYPILSPEKNETTESILDKWDKFDLLQSSDQDKISSKDSAEKIKIIGDIFRLTPVQTGRVSIAICRYYFNELKKEDFQSYLVKEIPTDMTRAQEITRAVFQRIINDDSQEIENQAQIEKLSLSAALQKYPEVGEQLVTSNRILLNRFPEPARPSIKNWLSDYTFTMGFDPHDSAARGIYLFQNKNTRNLNRQDQQNLNYILKAFDTNEPVEINLTQKQVVFPRFFVEKKPPQSAPQQTLAAALTPVIPQEKPLSPPAPSPRKGSGLLQRAHSANFSPQKNSIVLNSTTPPAASGTFTLSRKNPSLSATASEKKLTVAPNNAILPAAKKTLPERTTLQFTSPHKLPFEKQPAALTPVIPQEKTTIKQSDPLKITPRNFRNRDNGNSFPLPKNVVNLKEK